MSKRQDPKKEKGSTALAKGTSKAKQKPVEVEEMSVGVQVLTDADRAIRLCGFITEGDSVRDAAEKVGLEATKFYRMLSACSEEDAILQQYMRARSSRADARFERIDEIVAKTVAGLIDPAAARIAVDAIKWQTGKENAKRYGDKLDLTSGGERLNTEVIRPHVPKE